MAGVGDPGQVDAFVQGGENFVELLVADRMLFGPVEVDRADALVNSRNFAVWIADGELCSVSAVVKDKPVAGFRAVDEPVEAIQNGASGSAAVGEKPDFVFIEAAVADQEVGHIGYIVYAALQFIAGIRIDPDEETKVHITS